MGWSGLLGTDFILDVLDSGDTSVPNALEAYLVSHRIFILLNLVD